MSAVPDAKPPPAPDGPQGRARSSRRMRFAPRIRHKLPGGVRYLLLLSALVQDVSDRRALLHREITGESVPRSRFAAADRAVRADFTALMRGRPAAEGAAAHDRRQGGSQRSSTAGDPHRRGVPRCERRAGRPESGAWS